ncbi:hypothetical protein [Scytonema sp. PRP1]|uniref:hypothetical protein n=1 Tax=Scytonema sp. PRP1 TaxID=3120513 RepID=UPI002FD19B4C
MASISSLVKDDFEYLKVPTQTDFFDNSSINDALTAVAQEVAKLLQQAYAFQAEGNNPAPLDRDSSKPEYRQIIVENK